jgi:hypothetical protein
MDAYARWLAESFSPRSGMTSPAGGTGVETARIEPILSTMSWPKEFTTRTFGWQGKGAYKEALEAMRADTARL